MFQCRVNETELEKETKHVSPRSVECGGRVVEYALHELERGAGTPG